MARFGNLNDQYHDDAGQPLVSGKIFFFEPGTNTAKDTFADVNLSIKNPNPLILSGAGRQGNVFFNGSARAILTDRDEVQIRVMDPIGGEFTEGVFSPFNTVTIYNVPDIVIGSGGLFYVSITNGNQDNDPTTDQVNWTNIKFIRAWNPNETYSALAIAEGSDGFLYSSITSNNLNNDPVTDTINWQTSSNLDIPNVIQAAGKQFAYNNF